MVPEKVGPEKRRAIPKNNQFIFCIEILGAKIPQIRIQHAEFVKITKFLKDGQYTDISRRKLFIEKSL